MANIKIRNQDEMDVYNREFWNELCGTPLAQELGVKDSTKKSLKKYDEGYFDFYPYLKGYFPISEMRGRQVLDVGLGYGTLAQWLAENGVIYTGMDIARGPVEMVNRRIAQNELEGHAIQGSVLRCPFPDESFDYFVSIGCLHATGNFEAALNEAYRVLRPGGKLIFMVYYAYSYRRLRFHAFDTFRYWLWDRFKLPLSTSMKFLPSDRDFHLDGTAALGTEYLSERDIRRLAVNFSSIDTKLENFWPEGRYRNQSREKLLGEVSKKWGMDIYVTAVK
ncbi:MAG: class I SAM-dependent methyltransferase [Rhodospirillales bacterium]